MTDWLERGTDYVVTAKDLLDMQEAVTRNEEKQLEAWNTWQDTIISLPRMEQSYENAKWNAECAREELKMMLETVKGQK